MNPMNLKRLESLAALGVLAAVIAASAAYLMRTGGMARSAAEERPLEGVWDYRAEYEKFLGDSGSFSSHGTALLFWRREARRYQVYFGNSLKDNRDGSQVVTGFLKGFISGGEDGLPAGPAFKLEGIEYIVRQHANAAPATRQTYEYRDCRLAGPDGIDCAFETPLTRGKVRLRRLEPLR